MEEYKIYDIIDAYLTSSMSDEERNNFIIAIKKDVDLLKEVELNRAASIKIKSDEKQSLVDRFKSEYSPKKETPVIPFSDEKDDSILDFMNAAFAKNMNLLQNDNSSVDWETILKFLEGENE
jgi:hypothetical protein|tara:strand:- start:1176 stop:1541 length:366 start_codon:yes stop_codon:yes gene_type:complete